MKFIIFVSILIIGTQAHALSGTQQNVKNVAKEVGETHCFDICFTKTLQAITWQESSFGHFVIGDAKGQRYYYMHQGKDVSVKKSDTFVEDGIRYTFMEAWGEKFLKKVYSELEWKPLSKSSLGSFQIKPSTARDIIVKRDLTQYMSLLSNETRLINRLLNDHRFSAIIAVNFLQWNYERAKKSGLKNPWRYAVSKYNGGSNNVTYIKKITKKIRRLNEI